MSKPFDIDSFTYEDYKNVEPKELSDWIDNSGFSLEEKNKIHSQTWSLIGMTSFSEDDTLNEVFFDKLNNEYKKGGTDENFSRSVSIPLMTGHDPCMNALKNNPNLTFDELMNISGKEDQSVYPSTSKEIFTIMNSFISTNSKLSDNQQRFGITADEITQSLTEIVEEYTKRKDEKSSTLDAYTRNTKQNPLEKGNS